jgi:hypothetical protein
VRFPGKRVVALIGGVALALSLGALARALPASAQSPPQGATSFPFVPGVNGSLGSIAQINLSTCGSTFCPTTTVFQFPSAVLASSMASFSETPVTSTTPSSSLAVVTSTTVGVPSNIRMNVIYAQVSGSYCKDKTGGEVFHADGAPVEAGMKC